MNHPACLPACLLTWLQIYNVARDLMKHHSQTHGQSSNGIPCLVVLLLVLGLDVLLGLGGWNVACREQVVACMCARAPPTPFQAQRPTHPLRPLQKRTNSAHFTDFDSQAW